MHDKKRQGPRKDKRRGASPEEIATERGEAPQEGEANNADPSIDDQDHSESRNDRRERRRDRHE
jgi:hypothetical protein